MRIPYPTDLSDAEWNHIEPHMPAPKGLGRPRTHDLREILNAVFYLLKSGCQKLFEEQISSRKAQRPQLRAALEYAREGDALVVWKLDRFGRSLQELIELVGDFKERGVEFVSLRESIDTTSPGGKLVFHVFGAVAEFERDLVLERTVAGLEVARARGRRGGRPRALDESRARLARRLKAEGEHWVEEICSMLGVGRSTLYRYLAETVEAEDAANERGGATT